ncbi:F-box family protein [Rhynchospora pubera]|uniref:F-box family protein n=1 Tax=Rhynchospora pubera TaxID=906938 RepID=A0AAV8CTE7_9POAL|nr:F-box family protein [Rhynchospora pubera]
MRNFIERQRTNHPPANGFRDWSHLSSELLQLISEKISSFTDYISIRAVCVSWRSAFSTCPSHQPPPQFPWLMLPYNPNPCTGNDTSLRIFYDPVTCRTFEFNLPETSRKRVVGSSHGWLIIEDGPNVSLLNPITKAVIRLPSFTTTPNILHFPPLEEDLSPYPPTVLSRLTYDTGEPNIFNVILTSYPTLDRGCIVMVLVRYWNLVFCQVGDECWTVLGGDQNQEHRDEIGEAVLGVTYHDGLFYSINRHGKVAVYDLQSCKKELIDSMVPIDGSHCYLFASASGELLMLLDHHNGSERSGIIVYKLIRDGVKGKWGETHEIGDTVVFVDCSCQCFSLPVNAFRSGPIGDRMEGNRLFHPYNTKAACGNEDGYLFNVAIKSVHVGDLSYEKINPNLGVFHSTWSKSMWFSPSLC